MCLSSQQACADAVTETLGDGADTRGETWWPREIRSSDAEALKDHRKAGNMLENSRSVYNKRETEKVVGRDNTVHGCSCKVSCIPLLETDNVFHFFLTCPVRTHRQIFTGELTCAIRTGLLGRGFSLRSTSDHEGVGGGVSSTVFAMNRAMSGRPK